MPVGVGLLATSPGGRGPLDSYNATRLPYSRRAFYPPGAVPRRFVISQVVDVDNDNCERDTPAACWILIGG